MLCAVTEKERLQILSLVVVTESCREADYLRCLRCLIDAGNLPSRACGWCDIHGRVL